MAVVIGVVVVLALFVLILLASAIRILREYERGVIFRLGRLIAQKGPGLVLLIPIVDRMVRVDLRTVTLNVPPQELITRDNVTVRVNGRVRVVENDELKSRGIVQEVHNPDGNEGLIQGPDGYEARLAAYRRDAASFRERCEGYIKAHHLMRIVKP